MNFDITSTKSGVCEKCGSRGLLQRCAVMLPMEALVMADKPDIPRPTFITQEWCLGCMEGHREKSLANPQDVV